VALKLAGLATDDERMARLRQRIIALGGIQSANSYVKINLSLFELFPRRYCPTIPPEVMLMPFGFIYRFSAWTRAIAVSLAITQALRLPRHAPAGFNLDELWAPGVNTGFRKSEALFTWHNLFLAGDALLKWWERNGVKAVRRLAIRRASEWMLERLQRSDGLGAIYPPMMYSVMALDSLGYAPENPVREEALSQFNRLITERDGDFFLQPCFSPVWDTAIAAYAIATANPEHESLTAGAEWLLAREVRIPGDWIFKRPGTAPSGWAFEYLNDFYPDIDDTAMVLLTLNAAKARDPEGQAASKRRALAWLLAMQSQDGGWAAFDADNNWSFLSQVPFADHNAMLDPACADITGRVLEALGAAGLQRGHAAVDRGIAWLVRNQESDGSWQGRWGVAYLYGTCFALRGLAAAGEDSREAHMLRAAEWLRSVQNADGGWGESCAAYDRSTFVPAPSAPSQTAWALMGLIAAGDDSSLSVTQGMEYLVRTQQADGSWIEDATTGTGFPRVFYLRCDLYDDYFPVMALGQYVRGEEGEEG
jgi:squalene-hopene/tetraprenyl-beta-curcumene cyclase